MRAERALDDRVTSMVLHNRGVDIDIDAARLWQIQNSMNGVVSGEVFVDTSSAVGVRHGAVSAVDHTTYVSMASVRTFGNTTSNDTTDVVCCHLPWLSVQLRMSLLVTSLCLFVCPSKSTV